MLTVTPDLNLSDSLTNLIGVLAKAEGLFVWKPESIELKIPFIKGETLSNDEGDRLLVYRPFVNAVKQPFVFPLF